MFWLTSCGRCGGDLYEDRDHYGTYVSCLQCGASAEVQKSQRDDAVPKMKSLAARRHAMATVLADEAMEARHTRAA